MADEKDMTTVGRNELLETIAHLQWENARIALASQHMLDNLTATQTRCTALIQESRGLRIDLKNTLRMIVEVATALDVDVGAFANVEGPDSDVIMAIAGALDLMCSKAPARPATRPPEVGDPALARNEEVTIKRFQAIMLDKLRKNAHKGGWKGDQPHMILARLIDEVGELARELHADNVSAGIVNALNEVASEVRNFPGVWPTPSQGREAIAKEAADVANFAMMVADTVGGLDKTEDLAELLEEEFGRSTAPPSVG